jgi:large subunit ribosomal protein L25
MALTSIPLAAASRTVQGSRASNRLRRTGELPAVLYGASGTRNLQLNAKSLQQALRHHTSEYLMFDLAVDGAAPVKALLRDVQHDSMSSALIHVDFQEISADKRIRYDISIEPVGVPVGVSGEGGNFDVLLRSLTVECLPADMVEGIKVDVSNLKVGAHIDVSALPLDRAVFKVITPAGVSVFAVSAPKVEEEATTTAAESGAAGTPEVLKEKKPEEGAAAGKDAKAAPAKADAKKK